MYIIIIYKSSRWYGFEVVGRVGGGGVRSLNLIKTRAPSALLRALIDAVFQHGLPSWPITERLQLHSIQYTTIAIMILYNYIIYIARNNNVLIENVRRRFRGGPQLRVLILKITSS